MIFYFIGNLLVTTRYTKGVRNSDVLKATCEWQFDHGKFKNFYYFVYVYFHLWFLIWQKKCSLVIWLFKEINVIWYFHRNEWKRWLRICIKQGNGTVTPWQLPVLRRCVAVHMRITVSSWTKWAQITKWHLVTCSEVQRRVVTRSDTQWRVVTRSDA